MTSQLSFPESIRLALIARDLREKSQIDLVEHCRKLVHQLVVLKERNLALLKASSSGGSNTVKGVVIPSSSNSSNNPTE